MNWDLYDKALGKTLAVASQASFSISNSVHRLRNKILPRKPFDQAKFSMGLVSEASNSLKKYRPEFQKLILSLNKKSLLAYCAAASFILSNRERLSLIEYVASNALAYGSSGGRKLTPHLFFRVCNLAFKIQQAEIWSSVAPQKDSEAFSARLENLILRGTGRRPDQSVKTAIYRFEAHNEWLRQHLGLTIDEAVQTSDKITALTIGKLGPLVAKAENSADFESFGLTFDQYGLLKPPSRIFVDYIEKAMTFKLADIEGVDKGILSSFLNRFSGKDYAPTESFGDDIPLYDKPIIDFGQELFLPFPSLIIEALPEAFYRDLRLDKTYWSKNGEKKGKAAELRIIELLARAFPLDLIFPNPSLKKGRELIDALVLFEESSLIIESKSRYLSREARNNPEIVTTYLAETVKKGLDQAKTAEDVLMSGKLKSLTNVRASTIDITKRTIKEYLTILILDERLSVMVIHDYILTVKTSYSHFPFIVDINDFEYIVHEFDTPREFIQYLRDRQNFLISGKYHAPDELGLLGYYKLSGRAFPPVKDDEKADSVMLDGFWESYQEKYAEANAAKSKMDEVSYFIDHLIDRAHQAGPQSIIIAEELSKLTRTERRSLSEGALRKSMQSVHDSKPHYALAFFQSVDYGIIFLFTPEERAVRVKRLTNLTYLARIKLNNPKVIGIASEPANARTTSIDYCLINQPLLPDAEAEHLASQLFKGAEYFTEQEYRDIK